MTFFRKNIALPALLLLLIAPGAPTKAQETYQFEEIRRLEATPVKSQDRTGTCWAFSTASFLESEAIRKGKGVHDLSEMFVVRYIYREKCENYVRRQGKANLSEGALAHDLLRAVERYGIVPESVYPGRKDPSKPHDHAQLEKDLIRMCDEFVAKGKQGKLEADWLVKIDSFLDASFGKAPIKFTYQNMVFSPLSFRDFLGINTASYVTITSFTHHPFWETFVLEIPDNFSNGIYYNIPLNEMMRCLNMALQMGFTVEWDADVSNEGFSANNGLAIVPEKSLEEKNRVEKENTFKYWEPEENISQAYRQELFDRQITTDDHLMHIIGVQDEAHSGMYYTVKNSWGEQSPLKGLVYTSESYMRLNTIGFTLHKDAIPVDIRQRLGLYAGAEPSPGAAPPPPAPERTPDMELQPNAPSSKSQLPVSKAKSLNSREGKKE